MRLPTLTAFQEAAALVHETLDPTPQIAWPLLAESAPGRKSGSSTRTTRRSVPSRCGAGSSSWTICAGTGRPPA